MGVLQAPDATKLAAEETRRVESVRSLTFGTYLTSQWLPAKKLHLATSTYRGYERNVVLHILPTLGTHHPGPDRTPAAAIPADRIALRIAKQILYVERYLKDLAPDWVLIRDPYIAKNILSAA